MALAYDASSTSAVAWSSGWTHTPSGTPRAVIVFLLGRDSGGNSDKVTGITYGGTSMTEVSGSPSLHTGSPAADSSEVYCYILVSSVPTGAQTVSVSGTTPNSIEWGCAITVTGDADGEEEDNTAAEGTAANPSVSLTTGAGVNCFVAGINGSGHGATGSIDVGADFTEVAEVDQGTQVTSVERRTSNSTGGSVTVDWVANNEDYNIIAVALKEAAAAGVLAPSSLILTQAVETAGYH